MKKTIFIFLVLLLPVYLMSGSETSPYQFLSISPSVKADQMGNSFTAVVGPVDAGLFNPAILSFAKDFQLAFNFSSFGMGIQYINFGTVISLETNTGLYAGYSYMSYGEIETSSKNNEGIDISKKKLDLSSSFFQAGLGTEIWKNLSSGISLKIVKEQFIETKFNSMLMDIGFFYQFHDFVLKNSPLNIGANWYNSFEISKNTPPSYLILGASTFLSVIDDSDLLVSFAVKPCNTSSTKYYIGGALKIDAFFARIGYNSDDRINALRFGVDFIIKRFDISLTMRQNYLEEISYQFSVNIKIYTTTQIL